MTTGPSDDELLPGEHPPFDQADEADVLEQELEVPETTTRTTSAAEGRPQGDWNVPPSGSVEPIDEHFLRTVEAFGEPDELRPVDRGVVAARGPLRGPGREPAPRLRGSLAPATRGRLLHDRLGRARVERRHRPAVADHRPRAAALPLGCVLRRPRAPGRQRRPGPRDAAEPHLLGRPTRSRAGGTRSSATPGCTSSRRPRRSPRTCRARSGSASPWDSRRRWAGRRRGRRTRWSSRSFGDASVNHSTAAGAFNAAAYLTHVHRDCPLLLVCEDNGLGISTRTPRGWPAAVLQHLPGIPYFHAPGHDPVALLETTEEALAAVRTQRSPAVLHLSTVRFMGHAGSDVEIAYRSPAAIQADLRSRPAARHRPRAGRERSLERGGRAGPLRAGPAAGPRPVASRSARSRGSRPATR